MNWRKLAIFFSVVALVFIWNIWTDCVNDLENITKSPNGSCITRCESENIPLLSDIILICLNLEKRACAQEIEESSAFCNDYCNSIYTGFFNNRWCQFICGQCERVGVEPCTTPAPNPRRPKITRCKCGDECCVMGEICCGRDTGEETCCPRGDCCGGLSCCEPDQKCCSGECCEKCCGLICCGPEQICQNNKCVCPDGRENCLNECCNEGETCCGDKCCPEDRCADKRAKCCPEGQIGCGNECCCPDYREPCENRCCDVGEKCCEIINPRGEKQYDCCPIGEELCGPYNNAGPEDAYGYHCCLSDKCCYINETYNLWDCTPNDSMSCCPDISWCGNTEYCCQGIVAAGFTKTACCPLNQKCCHDDTIGPWCCDNGLIDCEKYYGDQCN